MKRFLSFIMLSLVAAAAFAQTDINSAIKAAAVQFSGSLKANIKVAVINVESESNELSEYIVSEFTSALVLERKLNVVTRQQLDAIKREMGYQQSGAVSDESMKSLGRQVGADCVVTGSLKKYGISYILDIQALDVETAAINDVYHQRISDDDTIATITGRRVLSERGKVEDVSDAYDYTVGERVGIGFQNILFGLGSYRNGHWGDGIFMSVLDVGGILLIATDDSRDKGGTLLGVMMFGTSVLYGFIRPAFYHRDPPQSALLGTPDGLNIGFAPSRAVGGAAAFVPAAKVSYKVSW